MKIILKTLYLTILILINIPNQVFSSGWESIYGWIYTDYIHSMEIDANKNYIMVGGYKYCETCVSYAYMTKADQFGDSLWAKTYIPGGALDISLTNDGNYIVAGYKHISPTTWDYYLMKTDVDGDTIWTQTYDIYGGNCECSVRQNSDGGYTCVWRYDPTEHAFFIMKTDSLGDTLWTRSINTHVISWGKCIAITPEEDFIVVGSTIIEGSEQSGYIVRIDSFGEILWDSAYGDLGYTDLSYIAPTEASCFIITGFTTLYHADYRDVYLLKINEDGDTLWTRKYGGLDYNDYGRCVKQTADGGYIITGWTYSYGIGTPDNSNVYLIKTDSLGNLEWQRTFGGMYEDRGYSVSQTDDGGYIIAGVYDHGPHTDVYLIKTDSLGYSVWVREIPMKPEEISLNVYPNPFNSSVTIRIQGIQDSRGQVEIFDLTGRKVGEFACPSKQEMRSGENSSVGVFDRPGSPGSRITGSSVYSWQPENNVTSGVYLVKATVGERRITKKVIYLK